MGESLVDVRGLKVRDEVRDLRYEPAVDLGDVVKGNAPTFIQDPIEFFSRTHFTESMKELVVKALMNIIGLKKANVGGRQYAVSSNLMLLPSDLGGGKTHSLILLYHLFKLISDSQDREEVSDKLRKLDSEVADFVSENWDSIKKSPPKVVVMDCKYSDLAPGPANPIEMAGKRIKTLWGYLGYELGRYDEVRGADERETAPYAEAVFKVLNGSKALILIDEIGRYYDESGLEATKISTFLMNLAEALSKYAVREVAVVISVPYEVREGRAEAKAGMEYVHSPELVKAINEVLSRPNVEILKPVGGRDLAEILRRRIFAHDKKELEKFLNDFMSSEFIKEYPEQVRRALDERGFWRELRETYPFHPAFLSLLEKLAYKLPYLQKTRDTIKIAVQTVLALKEGLFDDLEDGVSLIMPYHVPLFVSEALDETVLRNAPDEYKAFYLILKNNVAVPEKLNYLKGLSKEEFYGKVIARDLRDLREEEAKLGFKLAAIIWMHSLVGLGLPLNMGDFPTTAELIYSVSPTDRDVKGALGILRSVLPQLIVHGDPESDNAKWFFTRIPSIEELVEILKKNVTDENAKAKLAELLEWGLMGKRGRGKPPKDFKRESIFSNFAVVKRGAVPEEILSSRDPVLVVFADKVRVEELLNLLKGRNNLVALAPHVEGIGEEEELAPEDIAGIKELTGLKGKTLWEGLLELLRYYVASESISEDNLRAFVGEKLSKSEGEYLKELLELLKGKVKSKQDYYYRHSWIMVNKCYCRVYYHRQGQVRFEEGLTLESDKPIPPIVEEFLRDKGMIPREFRGGNLVSIFRDYLGKDPEKEPIKIGDLWNFILSTDKANVPILRHEDFVNAAKELVKSLDYAVRVGGRLLWKPVFSSKEEAESSDEGSKLLKEVSEYLRKSGASWDDVELIHWGVIFDEWLNEVKGGIPSEMAIKVEDRSGSVLDIADIKFDPRSTIKSGKLFYEKKKYPVKLEYKLPDEILEGKEYEVEVTVDVGNFEREIKVGLRADRGIRVEPSEFTGKPPLHFKFRVSAERAGNYSIKVEVQGDGNLLDSRTIGVSVEGEWIVEEVKIEQGEPVEDGKLLGVRLSDITGLPNLIRIAKSYRGKISGSLTVSGVAGSLSLEMDLEEPEVLELLWGPINNLIRAFGKEVSADIEYTPESEPELRDVNKLIVDRKGLDFVIKKKRKVNER